ncbi:copper homeostasis protein CutC [uncultured Cohaesibacter sp.]|uniref:copper homeostasis protein CutC n=1 Tax=uncultured Cohaesibacter sp. TaxID=1002546 RepID=UPI0029310D56|nr:copper homeostasis protein CutC [uncultured Cohaesibacter sp.]
MLEVCVDSHEGLDAAVRGGADRIELCSCLAIGGLTPSVGFMKDAVQTCALPVHALIRPRVGGFVFSHRDVEIMREDILAAKASGLAGVVIGALNEEARLNESVLLSLLDCAGGLDVTFHRAFDMSADPFRTLEQLVAFGIKRVLTSGGALTALDGIERLRALIEISRGRISIMPGSGVNATNATRFLAIGARELHASCSAISGDSNPDLLRYGFDLKGRGETSAELVKDLKATMVSYGDEPR